MQCHWRFITIRIFELPTWRKAFVENRFTQFPSRGWWCPLFCTEIQVGWEELRSTVWALEAKPGCLWSRLQLVEGNWKSKMGQLDSIQQASSLLPWISANQWMLSNILSLLHLNCCSCDHASVYQVRVHGCSTLPPETNESQRSELGADRSQRYPTAHEWSCQLHNARFHLQTGGPNIILDLHTGQNGTSSWIYGLYELFQIWGRLLLWCWPCISSSSCIFLFPSVFSDEPTGLGLHFDFWYWSHSCKCFNFCLCHWHGRSLVSWSSGHSAEEQAGGSFTSNGRLVH